MSKRLMDKYKKERREDPYNPDASWEEAERISMPGVFDTYADYLQHEQGWLRDWSSYNSNVSVSKKQRDEDFDKALCELGFNFKDGIPEDLDTGLPYDDEHDICFAVVCGHYLVIVFGNVFGENYGTTSAHIQDAATECDEDISLPLCSRAEAEHPREKRRRSTAMAKDRIKAMGPNLQCKEDVQYEEDDRICRSSSISWKRFKVAFDKVNLSEGITSVSLEAHKKTLSKQGKILKRAAALQGFGFLPLECMFYEKTTGQEARIDDTLASEIRILFRKARRQGKKRCKMWRFQKPKKQNKTSRSRKGCNGYRNYNMALRSHKERTSHSSGHKSESYVKEQRTQLPKLHFLLDYPCRFYNPYHPYG